MTNWLLSFVLFLSFQSTVVRSACVGNISEAEYSALRSLYNSCHGSSWKWKTATSRWNISSPLGPCASAVPWEGIICTSYLNSCAIKQLDLSSYGLVGSLPDSLGNLIHTKYLALASNNIHGTIPASLGYITGLQELYLYRNQLTGNIPSTFANMPYLQFLYLYTNYLSGTIPDMFATMFSLLVLYINRNRLSGTIPPTLTQVNYLYTIGLNHNNLHGTLPAGFGSLNYLIGLGLYANHFTGSIPPEYSKLTNCYGIGVHGNLLTGTLPSEYSSLKSILYLFVDTNHLTGTLPSFIGTEYTAIMSLSLMNNFYSGTIPTEFGLMTTIEQLWLSNNRLVGTIPSQLSNLAKIGQLRLSDNHLSGTVPPGIFQLQSLSILVLSNNQLTGTLPYELGQMKSLQLLNVSLNHFNGPIDHIFPGGTAASTFQSLTSIDIGKNSLTGTIPPQLFHSTTLQDVSLYSNCFSGSIPEGICDAKFLAVLILDGLSSSPNCQVSVPSPFNSLVTGRISKIFMEGTIPSCVWTLRNLSTLHISDNGLTGFLPEIPVDTALRDINVANNNLRGTIPESIQLNQNFNSVVLSGNKLSGALLPSSFKYTMRSVDANSGEPIPNLDLRVNRLSGKIPTALTYASNIKILEGNLFQCNGKTIPQHDPESKTYICGSQTFNFSIFTWVVLSLICFVIIARIAELSKPVTTPVKITPFGAKSVKNAKSVSVRGTTGMAGGGGAVSKAGSRQDSVLSWTQWKHFWKMYTHVRPNRGLAIVDTPLSLRQVGVSPPAVPSAQRRDIEANRIKEEDHSGDNDENDENDEGYDKKWSPRPAESTRPAEAVSTPSKNVVAKVLSASSKAATSGGGNGFGDSGSPRNKNRISMLMSNDRLDSNCKIFFVLLKRSCRICLIITTIYMLLVFPMYILMKLYSESLENGDSLKSPAYMSTHSFQYSWISTSAYLHGIIPIAIILFFVILSSQIIRSYFFFDKLDVIAMLERLEEKSAQAISNSRAQQGTETITGAVAVQTNKLWRSISCYLFEFLIQLLNVTITLIVNIGYVLAIIRGLSQIELLIIQALLSMYKLIWNKIAVPLMISQLDFLPISRQATHQVFMNIFIYLIGPIIATYVSDSNCLLRLFTGQDDVTVDFQEVIPSDPVCDQLPHNLVAVCYPTYEVVTLSTTVSPTWQYTYQCSSTLLVDYIPVYIFAYTLSGILAPVLRYLLSLLKPETLDKYVPKSFDEWFLKDSLVQLPLTNKESQVVKKIRPSISATRPLGTASEGDSKSVAAAAVAATSASMAGSPAAARGVQLNVKEVEFNVRQLKMLSRSHLFDGPTIIRRMIQTLAVLLTFGLSSPVLSFIICVDSFSSAILWRLLLTKYINMSDAMGVDIDDAVEAATMGGAHGLMESIYLVAFAVGIFWGLVGFDMIADVYGDLPGGIVMLLSAFVLPMIYIFTTIRLTERHKTKLINPVTAAQEANSSLSKPGQSKINSVVAVASEASSPDPSITITTRNGNSTNANNNRHEDDVESFEVEPIIKVNSFFAQSAAATSTSTAASTSTNSAASPSRNPGGSATIGSFMSAKSATSMPTTTTSVKVVSNLRVLSEADNSEGRVKPTAGGGGVIDSVLEELED